MITAVTFYEKPGCATNQKQKKLLNQHGCILEIKSLIDTKFSPEELVRFFTPLPVAHWFNPNAPQIKQGLIDPTTLSAEEAILAMQQEPILIKRPLMIIKGEYLCGFDTKTISSLLDTPLEPIDNSCSNPHTNECEPSEKTKSIIFSNK